MSAVRHLLCSVPYKDLTATVTEGPNRVGFSLPSPEDGNISSFRNVVFSNYLESLAMDNGTNPSVIHHCKKTLESSRIFLILTLERAFVALM
jgi:hypothetical protein